MDTYLVYGVDVWKLIVHLRDMQSRLAPFGDKASSAHWWIIAHIRKIPTNRSYTGGTIFPNIRSDNDSFVPRREFLTIDAVRRKVAVPANLCMYPTPVLHATLIGQILRILVVYRILLGLSWELREILRFPTYHANMSLDAHYLSSSIPLSCIEDRSSIPNLKGRNHWGN